MNGIVVVLEVDMLEEKFQASMVTTPTIVHLTNKTMRG